MTDFLTDFLARFLTVLGGNHVSKYIKKGNLPKRLRTTALFGKKAHKKVSLSDGFIWLSMPLRCKFVTGTLFWTSKASGKTDGTSIQLQRMVKCDILHSSKYVQAKILGRQPILDHTYNSVGFIYNPIICILFGNMFV